MADETAEITIQYLNARQGNRPCSIKGDDDNYYTLSDAAHDALKEAGYGKGTPILISYYTNDKGFRIATHVGDWELPKDARGYRQPKPPPREQSASPPPPKTDAVPPKPAPAEKTHYGYIEERRPDGHVRTMPTVKEQFVNNNFAAVFQWTDPERSTTPEERCERALIMLRDAWENVMEIEPAAKRAQEGEQPPRWPGPGGDGSPPPSPDDYGNNPLNAG